MPCNSDYMRATPREELSNTLMTLLYEVGLLDEPPGIYGDTDSIDDHTQILCSFCKVNNVQNYSLELQMWWRDHQIADAERLKAEQQSELDKKVKAKALSKLTQEEKELLGYGE